MRWLRKKAEKPSKPCIEEIQAEKLTQLGTKLANLRQHKRLSLDEIVVMTRIPRRLLNAIEMGNMQDLPEPIYTQGLIRQFAEALGLNGVDFASDFPVGYQKVSFPGHKLAQPWFQLRPFHLYLLYIFVIICSVNGLSQLLNQTAVQANNSKYSLKLETNSSFTPHGFEHQSFQEIKTGTKSAKADSLKVDVTLTSSSWIRVVSDGKTEFEGVLPPGSQRNWKAAQELTVTTDNAGAILMSINNQQPQQMGKSGKAGVVRIAQKFSS
jgi:cytoskeletal protein RodZ